jgi:hypothetical protein
MFERTKIVPIGQGGFNGLGLHKTVLFPNPTPIDSQPHDRAGAGTGHAMVLMYRR